jgi:hypothetical protein
VHIIISLQFPHIVDIKLIIITPLNTMASETTVQTPAAIKLFVGNLPFDITEEDLQKLFIDFGNPYVSLSHL